MSEGQSNRGGETPENRMRMREMLGQLKESGTDPREARRIVRECALRQDGDLPGRTQRRDISDEDRRRARERANNPG